ncbi:putative nucleolar protein 58 [Hyaloscypha bicolor E]|uniref:Nucleolar protein 58 n=1 Tax=Hyaloscypha bicolor E TaxID=1095630 RepID=A0A2J6TFT9_9HELO|nr:putative nucleolar protein 58 [Hyaloscypha bicolor E]PMD61873.1 putative nucleolar protein 58 [Hyaloscypha bicolor E]
MGVFVLTETSAGFALFKAKDSKIFKKGDLSADVETAEGINGLLKLKHFEKFDSAATALEEIAALVEGKVSPMLAKILDTLKDEKKASLAVADPKLGVAINKLPGLTLNPISDSTTFDIYRAIRDHLPSLIPGLLPENISTMSLGLSHSLSRHKLKFSPDKVDTMIVQAIALLDDLDKELNTYAMRVKEWYGWHFPEMGKIVNDNLAYARVILKVGMRTNCSNSDLSEILPEEIETAVKAAAEVSMGTEITEEDLDNIQLLAEQVVGFTEYRQQLSSYLTARMLAIAPNLTELVGELVGARLIAHSGSLMNLAKSPASTIQILGAEKALFRALKTKHDTPKYGLIYHASLVGQATGKNKGKIARMLAAKAAIGLRVDALSDWSAQGEGKGDDVDEEERSALGVISRAKIERHLRGLEGKPLLPRGVAVGPNGKVVSTPGKWEVKEARKYNPDADGLAGDEPAAIEPVSEKKPKKEKKEKKEKKARKEEEVKKPLIEEVSEDEDVEMADGSASLGLAPPNLNGTKAKPIANLKKGNDAHSDTLSTERRQQKAAQETKRASGSTAVLPTEDPDVRLAEAAGLSLKKYKKKMAKGLIKINEDGTPAVVKNQKKDKAAEPITPESSGKKRKHEDSVENGGFKWKEKRKDDREGGEKRLERGYRNRSRSPRRERQPESKGASVEDKFGVADKFGPPKKNGEDKSADTSKPPERAPAPAPETSHGEPMIIVHVNDRLGTKAAIPCLASDPIKLFKAQVAARIGRQPHEILLKRQGERPFKDQLTLEDYGVSNGVQIDLEIDTGE